MTDIEKLESLVYEIDNLVGHFVTTDIPAFRAWKTETERFLVKKYGESSFEYRNFVKTSFRPGVWTSRNELVESCKNGLIATKMVLKSYLEELKSEVSTYIVEPSTCANNRIFVVHGHDGELKHSVARIIEKQGIEAIILSEQANKGRTIIEKFEDYSDVGGAICLFTADDYGRAKADKTDNTRARQNVVLETGYFMGKLGRSKVVVVAENGLELPSDMQGIVYTDKNNWQFDVLKELKAIGYTIDYNKID